MRDGPSMRAIRLGSLPEGRRVRILRNTGVAMNGYDWFAIRFRGRIAYQWGGIMCADTEIAHVYRICGSR